MKGKIKLVPIEIPEEEMQVVWKAWKIGKITDSKPVNEDMIEFEGEAVDEDDLQQIVIKYRVQEPVYRERNGYDGVNEQTPWVTKFLPLHPQQWFWALAMIGHEVEFNQVNDYGYLKPKKGFDRPYASIITPTPSKDYIEEKNVKAKEFISEHGLPDGWDKKKITGEDVAALLHGIHTHAGEIANTVAAVWNNLEATEAKTEEVESKIYYAEDDLLPILKALGLPEPVWKNSISLDEWLKLKSNNKV